ncbi:phage regulatory CII family protein [Ralstonia pseudosolanacearum]
MSEVDQHEALYGLATRYPGGLAGLAHALSQRTGKRVYLNVLRNKLRPGIDTHHITLEDFSLILELCEEARVPGAHAPLEALCWRHGRIPVELPQVDADDPNPARTVCQVMAKVGDLAATVAKAAEDNVITEAELDGIEAEFLKAQVALATWHAEIRSQAAVAQRRKA